ncbi:hypothetical protein ACIHAX_31105 [Nocardia sp. NPDC051929]|uniref:hypothetical protein n=1 Tax=unclassified Nocardia TaxID=2637762 RepID=UPI003431A4A3
MRSRSAPSASEPVWPALMRPRARDRCPDNSARLPAITRVLRPVITRARLLAITRVLRPVITRARRPVTVRVLRPVITRTARRRSASPDSDPLHLTTHELNN